MKFMKRKLAGKEKGFTLVELLVVIGIMGILAAIVVPSVTHFMGSGKSVSAQAELQNVQTAVTAMMAEQGVTSLATNATHNNDMATFPDAAHPLYTVGGTHYMQSQYTHNYYIITDTDGTVAGFYADGTPIPNPNPGPSPTATP